MKVRQIIKNNYKTVATWSSEETFDHQIKKVIDGSKSKALIPIHTEHEEYHKKWHPNVKEVQLGDCVLL